MSEASPRAGPPQGRGLLGIADVLTIARRPLAAVFVVEHGSAVRLIVLALAGLTDLSDGWVARRWGGSRLGAFLDPVADKIFVAAAFAVVLLSGELAWWEIALVLLRDILATLAFLYTVATRRPASLPARAGGKAVTLLQMTALFAFILDSAYLRPVAFAAAAVGVYAIYDYTRAIPTDRRSVGA